MSRFERSLLMAAKVLLGAPAAAFLVIGAASAQYKVVGPDGKITYTDRAPTQAEGKVTALGARAAPVVAEVALPQELRQATQRYPATLYVTSGACEPCDGARQLLRQRGVPYSEKQVATAEDSDALEKLTGARDAPTLTLGAQTLRGLSPEVWNSYLDAAGYPRESRLPANYQYPASAPLTERREAAKPAPAPRQTARAEAPRAPAAPAAPEPTPAGIRF
jgi:glutaredoxin